MGVYLIIKYLHCLLIFRCISWFVAEEPSISSDALFKRTYDQWLLGDLKEVAQPCLPDTLFSDGKEAIELTGNLVLQMNYILDICKEIL